MDETSRKVRHQVFAFYLEHCRPPTLQEIVTATNVTEDQVTAALQELHDGHHIVLHKAGVQAKTPISMAHPFSHLPTPFIVIQKNKSWWANCAWCAFGLASMLVSASPVTVSLKSGAIGAEMVFNVTQNGIHLEDGPGEEAEYIVHYSVPPSTWWNDVKFACGTIHVFKNNTEAAAWCDTRGFEFGETMGLETMWKLAKAWYEHKASYEYNRNTPEETSRLFRELGMVSKFWNGGFAVTSSVTEVKELWQSRMILSE